MARVRFLDQVPVGFYEVGNTGGGGGGTPGGSPGSIQYNNNGSFGGGNNLTWSPNTNTLTITGTVTATSFTGSLQGTASWASNSVSASTSLTASDIYPAIVNNETNRLLLTTGTGKISGSTDFTYNPTDYNFRIDGSNLVIGDANSNVFSGGYGFGFAQGNTAVVNGFNAYAQGTNVTATGDNSHAEGSGTTANGNNSHAEGEGTTATGDNSHAEGSGTTANGNNSHAEGEGTTATGVGSHAEGLGTITISDYQHAQGTYNLAVSGAGAFILGNGTSDLNRSNLIFASGSLVQVTGSVIATQGFTGSFQGTATTATQILSGSITASINPSSGTFNITSGSTNLLYVSSINGNMGVNGYITASAVYAPNGNIPSFDSTDLYSSNVNVSALLSFDKMTSLKNYIEIDSGVTVPIVIYESVMYFGFMMDGVMYDASNNMSILFRYSLSNTQDTVGPGYVEYMDATDSFIQNTIAGSLKFTPDMSPGIIRLSITNNSANNFRIRPMYRVIKQCLTQ